MSRPESVSSRTASRGSRTAIWRISFRFFSPPENPSFSGRLMKLGSMSTSFIFSFSSVRNSIASSGSSPRCSRIAFTAALRNSALATPGISTGYWNARNRPARARSSAGISSRFRPS